MLTDDGSCRAQALLSSIAASSPPHEASVLVMVTNAVSEEARGKLRRGGRIVDVDHIGT